MKQAIITFDPDRIAQLDLQAEAHSLAWIIKQALMGNDYPKERGIASIALIEDGCHLTVTPPQDPNDYIEFPIPITTAEMEAHAVRVFHDAKEIDLAADSYFEEIRSSIKDGARPSKGRFKL